MLDSTILDSSSRVVVEQCTYKNLVFNLSDMSCVLSPPHSLSTRSSSSQSFEEYDIEINELSPPPSPESLTAQQVVQRTKYYVDKVMINYLSDAVVMQ